MKKILICGDSFAADWTVKYPGQGWPNMLACDHLVTNLAQAGCGEYKIYLQLCSVDLGQFDGIVVSHTSANRIHVQKHPIHDQDPLHGHSDLIYTDIKEHVKKHRSLNCIIDFYENYFDLDHAKFMHGLICEKIADRLEEFSGPVLHMANIHWSDLYQFDHMLNFEHLFHSHRGLMNHYDHTGNLIIYQKVSEFFQNTD